MKIKVLLSIVLVVIFALFCVYIYRPIYNQAFDSKHKNVANLPNQNSLSLKDDDTAISRQKKEILQLVRQTINDILNDRQISIPEVGDVPEDLMRKENVFVTIRRGDALIGCVGNTTPGTLAQVLIKNTQRAMFDRWRGHLSSEDVDADSLNITVSILSPFVEIPFTTREELVGKLSSNDGLMLTKGKQKVLFLPQIWKDYPFAEQFLTNLEWKGRIKKEDWNGKIQAYKFTIQEFSEPEKMAEWRDYQIEMGQKALRNMVTENGDIIYGYDFENLSYLANNGNQVRKMGTIMAIAYFLYKTNDQTLIPFLKKSFEYVEKEKLIEQKDFKVGAKALLLMGTVYYEQATGETLQLRKDLVKHIVESYHSGVGFYVTHSVKRTSPFYDGESWLALSLYDSFYPDDIEVKNLLSSADETMINKYPPSDIGSPFFSLGLQAAAIRFEKTKDDKFKHYMREVSFGLMKEHVFDAASTCAAIEGLVAVARAMRHEDQKFFSMLYDYITTNLRHISVLQIVNKNPFSKDKQFDEQSKRFEGSFLTIYRKPITRCDSTGHCTLALMNYKEL